MKKALKTILLFVLVIAMLIPTTVTTFAASLPIQTTNEYIVLQKANYVFNSGNDRQVESVKTVYDFAGNTFYVAECTPTGYYIYNEKFYGANPNGSITVDAGQRQIVVAVHENDGNNKGDNDAKEVALELSARNDVTVKTLGLGRLGLSALNKSTMNNDLSDGRWIVGNVFTDDSDWSGHSIVIQSYNSSTQVYTYWDPWTNTIGTFTKTQLNNDTIHLTTSTTDRVLAWIQRCY